MTAHSIVSCGTCGRRNRVPAAAAGTPRCGQCHTALPWTADAGDQEFTEIVERSPIPVLVDLWAPWCGPCRMVSPALEDLARTRAGQMKLVKVNVDTAPQTAQRFQVQAVPTLILLERGNIVARRAGAAPPAALSNWLDDVLPGVGTPQ
ncbi:thioredoxin [Blastococcus sp. HT6-30]|uniref:thioredoxin n=1 Tax=Blastococcus sp. HT6-30 TaxID=3144843 RepID=UPI00321B72A3